MKWYRSNGTGPFNFQPVVKHRGIILVIYEAVYSTFKFLNDV